MPNENVFNSRSAFPSPNNSFLWAMIQNPLMPSVQSDCKILKTPISEEGKEVWIGFVYG